MKTYLIFALFFSLTLSFLAHAEPLKVGLVLDKGGKDDKSFNSAAFAGANKAKSELGIQLKYVEATDDAAIENLTRAFAQKEYDLIIGVGFAQAEAIGKVAKQYPQKKFAIVDAKVDGNNVRSLLFAEHEGSYLVGAIAALTSKTQTVGFVGGMDVPLIRRFQMGYEAGAKKINPKIKVITNFVGVTPDAWNNPAKAKELALAQYSGNADVIYGAAGASNNGLFDAAEEKKKFAIGVDSNQNWVKPGLILTSMLKRVDVAVFDAIKSATDGKFKGGVADFGLKNKGIDYAVDEFNDKILTQEARNKADELKKQIMSGKLVVPDYYKKNAKK